MFIHDALLEAVLCGQSEVPARALQNTIHALETPVQDGSAISGMDLEFKVSKTGFFVLLSKASPL